MIRTGDGKPDDWIPKGDLPGDGVYTDEDGNHYKDIDGDGTLDPVIPIDKDGDGKPDDWIPKADLPIDGVYTDKDGNHYKDTDGDGTLEPVIPIDKDGDRKPDFWAPKSEIVDSTWTDPSSGILYKDVDGDGIYEDARYVPIDRDGDGRVDGYVKPELVIDGVYREVETKRFFKDMNGDGILDPAVPVDKDGDNAIDMYVRRSELDANGVWTDPNTGYHYKDMNDDGILDWVIGEDTDGDGIPDKWTLWSEAQHSLTLTAPTHADTDDVVYVKVESRGVALDTAKWSVEREGAAISLADVTESEPSAEGGEFHFGLPGRYTVRLTAENTKGDEVTQAVTILVEEPMTSIRLDAVDRADTSTEVPVAVIADRGTIKETLWTVMLSGEKVDLNKVSLGGTETERTFRFPKPGTYSVTAQSTDSNGNTATATHSVIVGEPLQISLSPPKSTDVSEDVVIDVRTNGTEIRDVAWKVWLNGQSYDYSGITAVTGMDQAVFSFVEPGLYEVVLEAADVYGNTAQARVQFQLSAALRKISFAQSKMVMELGDTMPLNIVYEPENTTDQTPVTWTSSNSKVAFVYRGNVSANDVGKAVIYAEAGSLYASCEVEAVVSLQSVSMSSSKETLTVGDTTTLTVTCEPNNATYGGEIQWSSEERWLT